LHPRKRKAKKMADTSQRPFTWTPKEPKHKDEDDANDPFSDDRCYETVNVPGGGTTGAPRRFKDTLAGQARAKRKTLIVSLEGQKKQSFPMMTAVPDVGEGRTLMCVCDDHAIDEAGPLLRLDAYQERCGRNRRYVWCCKHHIPGLLGGGGLKTRLLLAQNSRCCVSGEKHGGRIPVLKVGGPWYPWGHQHAIAHLPGALKYFPAILAVSGADPRKIISVEEGVDAQQADQFLESLAEAAAEIDPTTYVAPPADFAQSQDSARIDEETAQTSQRRAKRQAEKEAKSEAAAEAAKEELRAAHARLFNPNPRKKPKLSAPVPATVPASVPAAASTPALAAPAPAPAPAPVAPAPAPATDAEREVIEISSDDEGAPPEIIEID